MIQHSSNTGYATLDLYNPFDNTAGVRNISSCVVTGGFLKFCTDDKTQLGLIMMLVFTITANHIFFWGQLRLTLPSSVFSTYDIYEKTK